MRKQLYTGYTDAEFQHILDDETILEFDFHDHKPGEKCSFHCRVWIRINSRHFYESSERLEVQHG